MSDGTLPLAGARVWVPRGITNGCSLTAELWMARFARFISFGRS